LGQEPESELVSDNRVLAARLLAFFFFFVEPSSAILSLACVIVWLLSKCYVVQGVRSKVDQSGLVQFTIFYWLLAVLASFSFFFSCFSFF